MNTVFKRKFRYTLEGTLPGGTLEPTWVKIACRPPHPDVTTGGTSEQCHFTVYEMELSSDFWKIIQNSVHENCPYAPEDKLGTFVLKMYDGCGQLLETHTLGEAYISSLVWGDDYSTEYLTFEFDVRYRKIASVPNTEYKSLPYHMGLGFTSVSKTKCPNCQHEFHALPSSSIIY